MWTRGCTLRSTSGRLGGQYNLSAEVPLPFMQDNGRAEREPITVSYTVSIGEGATDSNQAERKLRKRCDGWRKRFRNGALAG